MSYHSKPVLWDIDLDVPPGVLGGDCRGRTARVRVRSSRRFWGLSNRRRAHIYIYGKRYLEQRSRVAYVPQRNSVDWDFPNYCVRSRDDGAIWAAWVGSKRPGAKERKAALAALEQVGMEAFAKRQISQLSGGQQQRVFLARALVQEGRRLFYGRTHGGCGRHHRTRHHQPTKNAAEQRQNRHRGTSRFTNRSNLF